MECTGDGVPKCDGKSVLLQLFFFLNMFLISLFFTNRSLFYSRSQTDSTSGTSPWCTRHHSTLGRAADTQGEGKLSWYSTGVSCQGRDFNARERCQIVIQAASRRPLSLTTLSAQPTTATGPSRSPHPHPPIFPQRQVGHPHRSSYSFPCSLAPSFFL